MQSDGWYLFSMNRHWQCLRSLLLLLAIGTFAVVGQRDAAAHANLIQADPPVDGLVAAPPSQLRLVFSEEVYVGGGSPSNQLLDGGRQAEGTSLVGSGVSSNRP